MTFDDTNSSQGLVGVPRRPAIPAKPADPGQLPGRRAAMRSLPRFVLATALSLAAVLTWAPATFAADSGVTVNLTLEGSVSPDVGFSFTVLPGVGGDSFCVSQHERDEAVREGGTDDFPFPVCTSGVTYTRKLTLAKGETASYEIGIYRPTTARTIWSGEVTSNAGTQVRSYVFDFDLPATDTVAATPPEPSSPSSGPSGAPIVLAVAAVLGWLAWSMRRRPSTPVGSSARR
jgi:hypothetical protein